MIGTSVALFGHAGYPLLVGRRDSTEHRLSNEIMTGRRNRL
jgi:hypothetical protein